jgi:SagB-type dehydrogenase family enzyme
MLDPAVKKSRDFLKYQSGLAATVLQIDQNWGLAPPPPAKPFSPDATRHDLTPPAALREHFRADLQTAIGSRRSHRRFTDSPLTLEDLSFLLWATQGVQAQIDATTFLRTIPSAGARHALETYLFVFRVANLPMGVYRYLPIQHQLLEEYQDDRIGDKLIRAAHGQSQVGRAAVTFVWTAVPYRMEWRYGIASHKFIALEAGHACQNLYLACEAIKAGTCAIAVYQQDELDSLVRADGTDEFSVYLAPVGKVRGGPRA